MTADDLVRRADVCAVAIAECFRDDGELLANPIGTIPMIGGRLARATFAPDLMMTDGEAQLVANDEAFQKAYAASAKSPEAWAEFRAAWLEIPEAEYQRKVREER